jgi:hypothetical protein
MGPGREDGWHQSELRAVHKGPSTLASERQLMTPSLNPHRDIKMTIAPTHAPSQPSGLVVVIATIITVGLMATAFSYGRGAHEITERSNALVVASESQAFCEAVGLIPQSEKYRNCLSGLEAIRLRQEQRWQAEAAGLL